MIQKKIQKELRKREKRRQEEESALAEADSSVIFLPKKPIDYNFNAESLDGFEYIVGIGNTLVDKKSDGFCVVLQIDKKAAEPVRMYSSSLNEWNPQCFPELLDGLNALPSGLYYDEMLGKRPDGRERWTSLDEFNAVDSRPKRKAANVTSELLQNFPLKLDIFDIVAQGGRSFQAVPLIDRRQTLEGTINSLDNISVIESWNANSAENLQRIFTHAIDTGYEGLVAKDPDSYYEPGSKNSDWIKLKGFTTFDLAVLGFYETPESRKVGKPFSAVLVGTYNTQTGKYESIAKVKVGKKSDQEDIYKRAGKISYTASDYINTIVENPTIVFNPKLFGIERKIPNRVVDYNSGPIAILEIQALDVTYTKNWHSCGIGTGTNGYAHSLRIPTFVRLRDDKTRIQDVTTTKMIQDYFNGRG